MTYAQIWFKAFVLTVAIEVPLVVALTASGEQPFRKRVGIAVLAQVVTHPLVWFLFPFLPGMSRFTTLTLSELWAWLGEAALYALTRLAPSTLRAVAISAFANAASLAIGFIVL